MSQTVRNPLPQKAIVTVTDTHVAEGMSALRWQLRDLVMDGACLVVIDVSELEHISSPLLAALLDTHRVCRQRGGGVVIRHANRRATELLHRSGLDKVFKVEDAS